MIDREKIIDDVLKAFYKELKESETSALKRTELYIDEKYRLNNLTDKELIKLTQNQE